MAYRLHPDHYVPVTSAVCTCVLVCGPVCVCVCVCVLRLLITSDDDSVNWSDDSWTMSC